MKQVHMLTTYYFNESAQRFEVIGKPDLFTTRKKAIADVDNRVKENNGYDVRRNVTLNRYDNDQDVMINYKWDGVNGYGQHNTVKTQYIIETIPVK